MEVTTPTVLNATTSNAYVNNDVIENKKQPKRRRRVVKNEIVRIDDINELPGNNFANWIKITKLKLVERESKLMSLRVNIIQDIINSQIGKFKAVNSRMKIYIDPKLYENIINEELVNNCLDKLNTKLIDKWNGIVLNHSKHKFDSYRKYFTTSRSWFDQRKRAILAQYLWIETFNALKKCIKIAAKRYFNERFFTLQKKLVKSLTLQIITNIFKQKLKLPSTRPHSLISCSILKECHIFQSYLNTDIDQSIFVNKLLQKNPDMSAVTLMGLIINILEIISNKSNTSFQNDVYQLFDEFGFEPAYVEPLTDYSQNIKNYTKNKEKQMTLHNNNQFDTYDSNTNNSNSNNSNTNNAINNNMNNNNNHNINSNNNNNDDNIYEDYMCDFDDSNSFMTNFEDINDGKQFSGTYYRSFHSQSYVVTDQRFSPLI